MARSIKDLDREDAWDFEGAKNRPGVKGARAVVSVAFARDDLQLVSEEAERCGMRVSEFIRTAAVKEAHGQRNRTTVFSTSGSLGFTSFIITAMTGLHGKGRTTEEPKAVTI